MDSGLVLPQPGDEAAEFTRGRRLQPRLQSGRIAGAQDCREAAYLLGRGLQPGRKTTQRCDEAAICKREAGRLACQAPRDAACRRDAGRGRSGWKAPAPSFRPALDDLVAALEADGAKLATQARRVVLTVLPARLDKAQISIELDLLRFNGSSSFRVGQGARSTRRRRRSKPARPYISRLISFSFVIWPSD